jgi:hypothetical protein
VFTQAEQALAIRAFGKKCGQRGTLHYQSLSAKGSIYIQLKTKQMPGAIAAIEAAEDLEKTTTG